MTYRIPQIFTLLALIFYLAVPTHAAENNNGTVWITLVADEGVLIRSGETAILVDTFGENVHHDLVKGEAPFSSIQLAFISHSHPDHFNPATMRTFLINHPETVLASSSEIIKLMRDGFPGGSPINDRLLEVKTEKGKITSIALPGIKGDFIELKHSVSPLYPDKVLGHIIHIGKKEIFYIGEAEMTPENWQPYNLKSYDIDIVILPYWIYKEETTRKIIEEHIAPKRVIVTMNEGHELSTQASELSRIYPRVIFLDTLMQSFELE